MNRHTLASLYLFQSHSVFLSSSVFLCVCVFLCSLFSSFIYFLPFVSLRFFLISLEFVKFKRAHLPQTDTMNTVCSVCVSECVYIVITELMRNFFSSSFSVTNENQPSKQKQQKKSNKTATINQRNK